MTSSIEHTVLLPVPLALVSQVAAYLDSLNGPLTPVDVASSEATADSSVVSTVPVKGNGSWSEADIQALAEHLPYKTVAHLLDLCAAEERWVAKHEAEEAAGVSNIQFRNELGAFSKLTRRLFGVNRWPMEHKKELGVYYYRFDPQIAAWWAAARNEVGR